ncbi:MAG: hypothetical protein V3S03_03290 [Vicinamibacteria bacterium]
MSNHPAELSHAKLSPRLEAKVEAWIADHEPRGHRIWTSCRKDPDGWHVHVDVEKIFEPPVEIAGATEVVQCEGFRIGPWPSRQVARRELRGGVRRIVFEVVRKIQEAGGTVERCDIDVHMPALEPERGGRPN